MFGVAECCTEADVDECVWPAVGQRDAELVDEARPCDGADFGTVPLAVANDAGMAPDRHTAARSGHSGRSTDVVKVGIDDRGDLGVGLLRDGVQRVLHLLDALAGVDCDQTVRAFDEGLVRQPISDHAPDAVAYLPEFSLEPLAVSDARTMRESAVWCRHRFGTIRMKARWVRCSSCHHQILAG
jgi:hypothetical protein